MAITAQLKAKTNVSYLPDYLNLWVGVCAANETVIVLWRARGGTYGTSDFVYIQYKVDSTGKYKRGYVKYNNLKNYSSTPEYYNYPSIYNTADKRRGRLSCATYCGAGSDRYEPAGSISQDEVVGFLGKRENASNGDQYAFIEYWVTSDYGEKLKHAWVKSSNLKMY